MLLGVTGIAYGDSHLVALSSDTGQRVPPQIYADSVRHFLGIDLTGHTVDRLAKKYAVKMSDKFQLNQDNQIKILQMFLDKEKITEAVAYWWALYNDTIVDETNAQKALQVFKVLNLKQQASFLLALPSAYTVINGLIAENGSGLAVLSDKDCQEAALRLNYTQEGKSEAGRGGPMYKCSNPAPSWEYYVKHLSSNYGYNTSVKDAEEKYKRFSVDQVISACVLEKRLPFVGRFEQYLKFLYLAFEKIEGGKAAVAFKISQILDEAHASGEKDLLNKLFFGNRGYSKKEQRMPSMSSIYTYLAEHAPQVIRLDNEWALMDCCYNDACSFSSGCDEFLGYEKTVKTPIRCKKTGKQYAPFADEFLDKEPGFLFYFFTDEGLQIIHNRRYVDYDFYTPSWKVYIDLLTHYLPLFETLGDSSEVHWFVRASLDLLEDIQEKSPEVLDTLIKAHPETLGKVISLMQDYVSADVLDKQFAASFSKEDLLAEFLALDIDDVGNVLALP